ncbi:MAG: cytidylate kinase family protein, partial [Candidatus Thermoplasmatota archaeon]
IDADITTRAERIVKREGGLIEERKKEMIDRERSEAKRYKKYYNVDIHDTSFYDLVVDSTNLKPEEITSKILKRIGMD